MALRSHALGLALVPHILLIHRYPSLPLLTLTGVLGVGEGPLRLRHSLARVPVRRSTSNLHWEGKWKDGSAGGQEEQPKPRQERHWPGAITNFKK